MTVLGGNQARGLGTGAVRKHLVTVTLVVVGIAAAFGLSRLIDGEQATVYTGPMVERSMAMQDDIDILRKGATAGSGSASASFTLEQELAQIHAGRKASSTAPVSPPGGPR
jgi:hypothetical protein